MFVSFHSCFLWFTLGFPSIPVSCYVLPTSSSSTLSFPFLFYFFMPLHLVVQLSKISASKYLKNLQLISQNTPHLNTLRFIPVIAYNYFAWNGCPLVFDTYLNSNLKIVREFIRCFLHNYFKAILLVRSYFILKTHFLKCRHIKIPQGTSFSSSFLH